MFILTFILTFGQMLPNFERLVLGCMDSYDSEKSRILQRFSRSTRFAFFCTGANAKIQLNFIKHFCIFAVLSSKFRSFWAFFVHKSPILVKFLRNFSFF